MVVSMCKYALRDAFGALSSTANFSTTSAVVNASSQGSSFCYQKALLKVSIPSAC